MSRCVGASAVAVTATKGTPGKLSRRRPRSRYSGRKSWPHWEMQCASSMATMATSMSREAVEEAVHHEPLGGHVEQVEPPVVEVREHLAALHGAEAGVERGGLDAELAERLHLVLHERDERAHDDADAGAHERRHLVAQALARAGRHHAERVVPAEQAFDDLLLRAPEAVEAEHAVQHLVRRFERRRAGGSEGRFGHEDRHSGKEGERGPHATVPG